MKVTVDFDMTPEEARRLMGLPDLAPLQAQLLEQIEKQMAQNLSLMDGEALAKALMSGSATQLGAQGLEQMQKLMWDMAAKAMGAPQQAKTTRQTKSKR